MGQEAGQKCGDEYRKGLVRHFFDSDNTVQVRKGGAKKTKADYLRAHCRTDHNNVRRKTYREGGYDGLGGIAVNSKKYQED